MKPTLKDTTTRMVETAAHLRVQADAMLTIEDEQEYEALGTTPWKLRRMALQLEETAARMLEKHAKIVAREQGGADDTPVQE